MVLTKQADQPQNHEGDIKVNCFSEAWGRNTLSISHIRSDREFDESGLGMRDVSALVASFGGAASRKASNSVSFLEVVCARSALYMRDMAQECILSSKESQVFIFVIKQRPMIKAMQTGAPRSMGHTPSL